MIDSMKILFVAIFGVSISEFVNITELDGLVKIVTQIIICILAVLTFIYKKKKTK